jgi:hypothetical protein
MNKMLVIPLALALVGMLGQHAFAVSYVPITPDGLPAVPVAMHDTSTCHHTSEGETCDATIGQSTSQTNEHDYQAGFKAAEGDYADCTNGGCDLRYGNDVVDYCSGSAIDNLTACQDGYINGWKHWCESDVGLFVQVMHLRA